MAKSEKNPIPNIDKLAKPILRFRQGMFGSTLDVQVQEMTGRNKGFWWVRYGSVGGKLRSGGRGLTKPEAEELVRKVTKPKDEVHWFPTRRNPSISAAPPSDPSLRVTLRGSETTHKRLDQPEGSIPVADGSGDARVLTRFPGTEGRFVERREVEVQGNPKHRRRRNPSSPLACPHCGGTIQGNPAPGTYTCSGCQASVEVA